MRGFDPEKHATQVQKGVEDLQGLVTKQDEKIEKAQKTAADKAAAKTKADDKVTELTDERKILVGRLEQAKAVLATLQAPGETKVPVVDADDDADESLPV